MATAAQIDRTQKEEAAVLEVIAGMAKARYEKNARGIGAPYARDAAIFNLIAGNADAHGKNDHAKGKEHSAQAQQHSQNARNQSQAAHEKSQQQK